MIKYLHIQDSGYTFGSSNRTKGKVPKKKTHGGKRPGSGRPSITDKKITLTIYPRTSEVERVGGKEKAKEIALKAIQTNSI